MAEKTNRRDLIVESAARLFVDRGYDATSVRQIAEEVGCTEAALYYHFREGKRALLQAVLEASLPDLLSVFDQPCEATSLADLLCQIGLRMAALGEVRLKRLRWVTAEFPRLTEDERALFHEKHRRFHAEFVRQVGCFIPDECEASQVAWAMTVAMFGYVQLFVNLELQSVAGLPAEELVHLLAARLAAGR